MASVLLLARAARADRGDLQRRERLAVALLAAVALAALVLEDDDLLGQALIDDLGLDRDALDRRLPDDDAAAVVGEQQRPEGHLRTGPTFELLDAKGLPLGHSVLLSSGRNDGVHGIKVLAASGVVYGAALACQARRRRRISLMALGFPLPPVSFMTAPTKKPISLGLLGKRAASSGWAAMTRLHAASSSPPSETWARPSVATMSAAVRRSA